MHAGKASRFSAVAGAAVLALVATLSTGAEVPTSDLSGYCHLQFPMISESTLYTDHPVLEGAPVVDFYGRCDYSPTGKEEVEAQRRGSQREQSSD